jgi:uncharacterized membrane-anchored protein
MNRGILVGSLFVVCCVVQFAVPASMILRHETTLTRGEAYRFLCAPVDPVDPFRGRYVALDFDQSRFTGAIPEPLDVGSTAYARLARDDEGFALVASLVAERPDQGDYLEVKIEHQSGDSFRLTLPFDRYYMAESLAPEAERAYRDRAAGAQAWVEVRVREGHAVLEELYLDGRPIREVLDR